jgi:transposase
MHHDTASSGLRKGIGKTPFLANLFLFRGRKANLIKIASGMGGGSACSPSDEGARPLPVAGNLRDGRHRDAEVAPVSMLIEGIDWCAPERRWRSAVAG